MDITLTQNDLHEKFRGLPDDKIELRHFNICLTDVVRATRIEYINPESKVISIKSKPSHNEKRVVPKDWQNHMMDVIAKFSQDFVIKYSRGAEEHGGNLHQKPAMDMVKWAFDEVIDLVSYLSVIQSHLEEILKITENSLNASVVFRQPHEYKEALEQISNILLVGNPEGNVQKGD